MTSMSSRVQEEIIFRNQLWALLKEMQIGTSEAVPKDKIPHLELIEFCRQLNKANSGFTYLAVSHPGEWYEVAKVKCDFPIEILKHINLDTECCEEREVKNDSEQAVKKKLRQYLKEDFNKVLKYDRITAEEKANCVITYAYLQKTLSSTNAFRLNEKGATLHLKQTLDKMEKNCAIERYKDGYSSKIKYKINTDKL